MTKEYYDHKRATRLECLKLAAAMVKDRHPDLLTYDAAPVIETAEKFAQWVESGAKS